MVWLLLRFVMHKWFSHWCSRWATRANTFDTTGVNMLTPLTRVHIVYCWVIHQFVKINVINITAFINDAHLIWLSGCIRGTYRYWAQMVYWTNICNRLINVNIIHKCSFAIMNNGEVMTIAWPQCLCTTRFRGLPRTKQRRTRTYCLFCHWTWQVFLPRTPTHLNPK